MTASTCHTPLASKERVFCNTVSSDIPRTLHDHRLVSFFRTEDDQISDNHLQLQRAAHLAQNQPTIDRFFTTPLPKIEARKRRLHFDTSLDYVLNRGINQRSTGVTDTNNENSIGLFILGFNI